ncbi:MAG: UDP-N-acetyl-D-glucosamine dehydrogenase [Thermoplasmata archaeon]|nr:MAG: UDP-N-acetyl-D-glucosamine dehydrogenase [Thermoplasmata archaeon]
MNGLIKKIREKKARVTIVGLGYVGYPLYKLIIKKGFNVIGLDIDKKKIDELKKEGLNVTTDPNEALKDADCIIVCVPTPIDENHKPDLTFLKSATQTISKYLKKETLVVIESTIAPGTTEEIIIPILERSGLKAGKDFYVSHCPERIDPGNKKWTISNIPRVIGGINKKSTEVTYELYKSIIDAKIVELGSIKSAEATKMVENAFRDINIAFVNELAKSFDRMGIDILEVIKAASTKPFGFMPHYPGCGVGGHCIPVDPYYLIHKGEKLGYDFGFLKLARTINDSMPEYTVQKVITGLNEIGKCVKNTNIAILGVAYKGGIDDIRESPALVIIKKLEQLGANLVIFDPYVPEKSTAENLDQALEKCECIVIATDHPEFKQIKPELLKEKGVKVVVDGRNILDKEKIKSLGIVYKGIGR